jgi:hypothetical protein
MPAGLFVSFVRLDFFSAFGVFSCVGLLYTYFDDFMIINLSNLVKKLFLWRALV